MALIDDIENIVTEIEGTFLLASKFRADLNSFDLESNQFPFVILDDNITINNEIVENGSINKNKNLMILCLDKDVTDNSSAETYNIVSSMILIADRIALRLMRNSNVIVQKKQTYKTSPAVHMFNTDLSGAFLEINLKENNLISCYGT